MFEKKRVLVLTPDATRTCPLPMMIRVIQEVIGVKAAKLDFMVALGTHTPLPEKEILKLYGITTQQKQAQFHNSLFLNHRWDRPETFRRIGYLSEEDVETVSQGRLREKVPIDINKKIYDYDLVVILGPVFPHEVVGFSGGSKYLFPGISGGEFLHFFHWLGAVMTCRQDNRYKRHAGSAPDQSRRRKNRSADSLYCHGGSSRGQVVRLICWRYEPGLV